MNDLSGLPPPGAEGEDVGVGGASDFEVMEGSEYIGPESKPVKDEDEKNGKKKNDTSDKKAVKIGEPVENKDEKKKGFLEKIFGKKNKEEN